MVGSCCGPAGGSGCTFRFGSFPGKEWFHTATCGNEASIREFLVPPNGHDLGRSCVELQWLCCGDIQIVLGPVPSAWDQELAPWTREGPARSGSLSVSCLSGNNQGGRGFLCPVRKEGRGSALLLESSPGWVQSDVGSFNGPNYLVLSPGLGGSG
jgi:hypothetical protein